MTAFLAQAVSSAFLIDPVKPVLAFAVALAGGALTSRLVKDIKFCGLPSGPWHIKMIGGTAAGLLAVLPHPGGLVTRDIGLTRRRGWVPTASQAPRAACSRRAAGRLRAPRPDSFATRCPEWCDSFFCFLY